MWYQLKAQNVTGVCVQKSDFFLELKKFQTKGKNIDRNHENFNQSSSHQFAATFFFVKQHLVDIFTDLLKKKLRTQTSSESQSKQDSDQVKKSQKAVVSYLLLKDR